MNKWALVTGASRGLGYEFSKKLSQEGYNLIICSRTESKLKEVKKEIEDVYSNRVKYFQVDLTLKKEIKMMLKNLQRKNISVDILINNAGFGNSGRIEETDFDRDLSMINLNIRALTFLTKYFIKEMKMRNRGYILNVSSTAAFQPGPMGSIYYASKTYVLNFSLALQRELRNSDVHLSVVCPGPTKTRFFKESNLENSKLKKMNMMTPEKVVNISLKNLFKNKKLIIPGFSNKILYWISKITPVKLSNIIVEYLMTNY